MLRHIHIENYALISQLDIDFDAGFSVLTGETGAGKSIILGALHLVMGGKADVKTITEGEKHCIIEATFDVKNADESEELIIRRELHATGRSRSFVNDEVVSQAELQHWAQKLIDIHSQHESLLLSEDDFQREIVDAIAFGHDKTPIETYQKEYANYVDAKNELNELKALAKKAQEDADYVQFQYNQLEEAHLQEGEQEELEKEQYQLSHAEEIKTALQEAIQYLDGEEGGAIPWIHSIHIGNVDENLSNRLISTEIELRDILREIQHLEERTEGNPQRLEEVEERIVLLSKLMQKHQVDTVNQLITLRDTLHEQCQRLDSFDEEIAQHEQHLRQIENKLQQLSAHLTKQRQSVRKSIAENLVANLQKLGVKHAKVDVEITPLSDYTTNGKDNVQFMFAANLNQSLRRVSEVASGGEISRLMLCIKALIASTNGLPTIIFDEIDTGVSGEIASQMGHIMRQMAHSRQIIAITHLPQIAALGEMQYKVYKEDTDRRTETHIYQLKEAERVEEIAAMIGGKEKTETSKAMAATLLKQQETA